MLLFSGEVETISTHQADITAQTSTQASSTIPVSGAAIIIIMVSVRLLVQPLAEMCM